MLVAGSYSVSPPPQVRPVALGHQRGGAGQQLHQAAGIGAGARVAHPRAFGAQDAVGPDRFDAGLLGLRYHAILAGQREAQVVQPQRVAAAEGEHGAVVPAATVGQVGGDLQGGLIGVLQARVSIRAGPAWAGRRRTARTRAAGRGWPAGPVRAAGRSARVSGQIAYGRSSWSAARKPKNVGSCQPARLSCAAPRRCDPVRSAREHGNIATRRPAAGWRASRRWRPARRVQFCCASATRTRHSRLASVCMAAGSAISRASAPSSKSVAWNSASAYRIWPRCCSLKLKCALQLLPCGVGDGGLAARQPGQCQCGGLPVARGIRPVGRRRQRTGRIAQRLGESLRGGAIVRRQPVGQAGDGAGLAGVGGAVDARPQPCTGQQALVVRGAEYRVAGVGQIRLGPQRGQVLVEIQCAAAGQLRLQRVAAERVAEAGLIQREEIVPVLPARQFQQERAAQVGGGNPVADTA